MHLTTTMAILTDSQISWLHDAGPLGTTLIFALTVGFVLATFAIPFCLLFRSHRAERALTMPLVAAGVAIASSVALVVGWGILSAVGDILTLLLSGPYYRPQPGTDLMFFVGAGIVCGVISGICGWMAGFAPEKTDKK